MCMILSSHMVLSGLAPPLVIAPYLLLFYTQLCSHTCPYSYPIRSARADVPCRRLHEENEAEREGLLLLLLSLTVPLA